MSPFKMAKFFIIMPKWRNFAKSGPHALQANTKYRIKKYSLDRQNTYEDLIDLLWANFLACDCQKACLIVGSLRFAKARDKNPVINTTTHTEN